MAVTEELNSKIAQEQKTRDMLLEAERRLATTSVGPQDAESRSIYRGESELGVTHVRPFAIPAKKVAPVDYLWRTLAVHAIHHQEQHKRPITEVIKDRYGEDESSHQVIELVTRAASAPATMTQAGWAAELVTQIWAGFMEALLPFSIYPELARRGQAFTFGRSGVINLPLRLSTPQISGSFVGEGTPIPVRQGAFATAQLTPKKMAVISTFTRELAEHSTPAIEGIIREAILHDPAIALDSVLLDTNVATAVRPPGLLSGVTGITPTTGGGINALIGDMKLLSMR
jgi:HK97 family phage major capsid protein